VDIAIYQTEEEAVALSSIAERQHLSVNYLEQLIAKLKKENIVKSFRGAQGGYVLARPAEEISVGEILRALEGDLNPVDCSEVVGGKGTACENADICVTKIVWKRITDSINQAVDSIMLSDLVSDAHQIALPRSEEAAERRKC